MKDKIWYNIGRVVDFLWSAPTNISQVSIYLSIYLSGHQHPQDVHLLRIKFSHHCLQTNRDKNNICQGEGFF